MKSLENLFNNEMSLLKVCAQMEALGVKIDVPYVEVCLRYEEAKKKQAVQNFEADTGRAFLNSSKLFAEIFTKRGESFPQTEKGNPSFTGDFLESCKSPTATLINQIRYHDKRAITYFRNFLYYKDEYGYLHPSMNQAGTATGRFSYSNPNLQNVSKEDDESDKGSVSNIRKCFVPEEEHVLLAIDYSSQEYRLMLDYANEKSLIKAVKEGADVHQATADLLGITRKQAKTINFGCLFGIGAGKLAENLGMSFTEAKEMRQAYFKKLPAVERFIKDVTYTAEKRGYVFNFLGRRSYCADYRFSYKLPNHVIQGSGADVVKIAMVRLHEFLKPFKSRMVLQVHDELLFYLHREEFHLVPEIKKIMEGAYGPKNGLDLIVNASYSETSWSHWEQHEWKH